MTYSIKEVLRRKPLALPYYPKVEPEPEKEHRVMLKYPFPLDDEVAYLVLPKDLNEDEARRVCALVMALAVPWSKPS